jgi:hypothetical protein
VAENRKKVKPTVNDQFWFDISKSMVEDASSSQNEAAAKLQQLIVWLWGIYTASATVGIALSKTSYPLKVIILIASPSAVLIFAYWFAVWVQMPVKVRFDSRIPADIKEAYNKGVRTKGWKLICAVVLSLAAAVLVALALIGASLSKQEVSANFKAYSYTEQEQDIIAITGRFPVDKEIVLKISSIPHLDIPSETKKLTYITTGSGELQTNIELDFIADQYEVTIEWWEDDGLLRSLRRIVLAERKQQEKDSI